MKPFNLEQAKAGKPIVTREGEKMKFIAHVPEAREDSRVITMDEDGSIIVYSEIGKNAIVPSPYDLFMDPEKREHWVNLYYSEEVFPGCVTTDYSHSSKEDAFKERQAGINYIGEPIKIYEEEV